MVDFNTLLIVKKIIISLFTLSISLFALTNDNPAAPGMIENGIVFDKEGWFGLALAYEYDHVFNRRMKAVTATYPELTKVAYNLNQGIILLNLLHRFEVYGSLGALEMDVSQEVPRYRRLNYSSSNDLAWGVGARALAYEWNNWSIGVDGKFLHAYPGIEHLDVNGTPTYLSRNAALDYREWQIGLGFAYTAPPIIPYIAADYSYASMHGNLPGFTRYRAQNRRKFGMAIGSAITGGSAAALNVEMRLIDELALSLSGRLQF